MSRRLPKDWILSYTAGIQPISEAPVHFNLWAAIAIVGAVLKNNVFLRSGTYTVYPNQYVVFVAPPGIGKGNAMKPAIAYVRDPVLIGGASLCNVMSDRITAPRIIERIATGVPIFKPVAGPNGTVTIGAIKDSSVLLHSTELSTLLSSSDWMMGFLCDTWDKNEFDYDTKNKGTHLVKGMCVSLIGACTSKYIRKLNKNSNGDLNNGFTARTIFVFAEKSSQRLPFPIPQEDYPGGKELIADLKADLLEIAALKGEFSFTSAAKKVYELFYQGPEVTIQENDSEVMAHFKSRMGVHTKKLAMVFSAAARDDLIIDEYDVTNAIFYLQQVKASIELTFQGAGDSALAEATAIIQNEIRKRHSLTKNQLLRAVYRDVDELNLDRVLDVLYRIGDIKIDWTGTSCNITSLMVTKTYTVPQYYKPPTHTKTAQAPKSEDEKEEET